MEEIEERGRRLISLYSEAKSKEWRAFKLSLDSVGEEVHRLQSEIGLSLRKVTDNDLDQLQKLQVSSELSSLDPD